MHRPLCETKNLDILPFEKCLLLPDSNEYDTDKWLYLPNYYSEYRYILGTRGSHPLITIGINPSTAAPGCLDNTLKSVERIAHFNGYDSFIMFNVYAQRATSPDDMDVCFNQRLHEENMKAFRWSLNLCANPSVWAAWGTIIEKRPYLKYCVTEMIQIAKNCGADWYTAGKRSAKGHPHHPLYLKKNTMLDKFDIENYTDSL